MNPAVSFVPKFYGICSVILILAGGLQLFVRPRRPNETVFEKVFNRAAVTAVLSLAFGVLGLLLAFGVIHQPRFH